jgi:hypothetical protein
LKKLLNNNLLPRLGIGESLEKIRLNIAMSLLEYMILFTIKNSDTLDCEEITTKVEKGFNVNIPSSVIVIALFLMEENSLIDTKYLNGKKTYVLTIEGEEKKALFNKKKADVLDFTQYLLNQD